MIAFHNLSAGCKTPLRHKQIPGELWDNEAGVMFEMQIQVILHSQLHEDQTRRELQCRGRVNAYLERKINMHLIKKLQFKAIYKCIYKTLDSSWMSHIGKN